MSLSSTSNTINAVGILGRMTSEQEWYFKNLSDKYSKYPEGDESKGMFNHLSLVVSRDVPVGKLSSYIDLLRELKPFLPFKIQTSGVIVKDDLHLALSFDPAQTQEIRDIATRYVPEGVVTAYFTKVVWWVPKENQEEVKKILEDVKEMNFHDFILGANRQDDANTIYSSIRYSVSK